jgi:hypothetical protein
MSIDANGRLARLNVPPHLRAEGLAATAAGGRCHVSPGRPCRLREVVFFGKFFERWSFLTIYWNRWSFVSKFPRTVQLNLPWKETNVNLFYLSAGVISTSTSGCLYIHEIDHWCLSRTITTKDLKHGHEIDDHENQKTTTKTNLLRCFSRTIKTKD